MQTKTVPRSRFKVPSSITPRERFDAAMDCVADRFRYEARRLANTAKTDDDRLLQLWRRAYEVDGDVIDLSIPELSDRRKELEINLRHDLASLAACVCAWLRPAEIPSRLVCMIWTERERQRALMRAGKIAFACESPIVDVRRKFRVLAEEIGEVAQALDQIENHGMARGNLHAELIQVAAVCVAWLESLPTTEVAS